MTLQQILNEVCVHFDCSERDILHTQKLLRGAKNAYYLIAKENGYSLAEIGSHINRSGETVKSGIKQARSLLETDELFARRIGKVLPSLSKYPTVQWPTEIKRAELKADEFVNERMPGSSAKHELRFAFKQGYLSRAKQ